MKCIIPNINIKAFSRAIGSLARVGDELYVEPSENGISFRTVNTSRSAFASFFFKDTFFSQFEHRIQNGSIIEEDVKCKVSMKACLNAFKSMTSSDRSVEKCKLLIDPDEDRLVAILSCRHNINKTYYLSFIECETLQAFFDKSQCTHVITGQSKILHDTFSNFHSTHEEVTLRSKSDKSYITNHIDYAPDPVKSIHTELTLEAEEFDVYKVPNDLEVTFCLKEVKSLIAFSEPISLPVTFRFSEAGRPIIFSVENVAFEANFVLATLGNSTNASQESARGSITKKASSFTRDSEQIDLPRDVSACVSNSSYVSVELPQLDAVGESPGNKKGQRRSGRPSLYAANLGNTNVDRPLEICEEEPVPETPPAKRQKFFFQRCFESTFDASAMPGFQTVYAEDSDEET